MNNLKIKVYDAYVFINSITIAIMCTSNLLLYLLMYLFNYNNGFYVIMGTVFGLFLISMVLYRSISKSNLISVSFLLLLVFLLYAVSSIFGRIGEVSVISFLGFCILPIICSLLEKDVKVILESILIISLLVLPVSNQLFEYQYVTLQQVDMSRAYAVFITISTAAIHFCWYRKGSNILIKIAYIANIYLLYKLLSVGNRGIIASVAFLIFVLMLRYIRQSNIAAAKRRTMTILFIIFGIFVVLLILNIDRIIIYLYNYFHSLGGTIPSFVIKMYKLIVYKSDISNGRDEVYDFFLRKVFEQPIIGYGMKMSSVVSNGQYPYPHNYILQMLFEGGIIFAVYPVIISLRIIFVTLLKKSDALQYELLLVFLLCNCIPKLLLSGDMWMQPILWLWLGIAATNFAQERKKNEKQKA